MATSPSYAATPVIDGPTALPATANTNYDGTGTITAIATGTTNGKRVARVRCSPQATVSAALQVNFFISHDAGSTWKWLGVSAAIPVNTVSTTNPPSEVFVPDLVGYTLVSTSDKLGAAPTTAQAVNVTVESAGI